MAKKEDVDRWEYPDGTPTTKQERAVLEDTGKLPEQTRFTHEDGTVHDEPESKK